MAQKITPVLWFNMNAEEAANFYVGLLPDSRVDKVLRAPADNPSTEEGAAIVVDFTLAGQKYAGLNGGTIQNLLGPATTGPVSIVDFATFNTTLGLIHFDLQNIFAGVGTNANCTNNNLGSQCTPTGSRAPTNSCWRS